MVAASKLTLSNYMYLIPPSSIMYLLFSFLLHKIRISLIFVVQNTYEYLKGADNEKDWRVESLNSGFIWATMEASSPMVKLQLRRSNIVPMLICGVLICCKRYLVYKLCERPLLLSILTKLRILWRVPYPIQKLDSQWMGSCSRLDSLKVLFSMSQGFECFFFH